MKSGSHGNIDLTDRKRALEEFAAQVTTLPFDIQEIRKTLELVEEVGGQELVVEACITAAGFETITRVVDATARVPLPSARIWIVRAFNLVMIHSIQILTVSIVGFAALWCLHKNGRYIM